jgi:hypothetical protein
MNAALEKTIFHLTQKSNLNDISVEELSHLVQQYPYFAPAQLALAVKLKQANSFQSQVQLQRTAIYVPNTNWLQYHLLNGDAKKFNIDNTAIDTNQPIEKTISSVDEYKAFTPHQQQIPTLESVIETMHNIDEKKVEKAEAPIVTSNPLPEHTTESKEKSVDLPSFASTDFFEKPLPPTYSGSFENDILEATDKQSEKYASILSEQLSAFKKPVDENAKLDFEMEPYYTIDYFASQGIKVDLTQQPQDKLTKQLLKFTDWLKKMKTVNPNPQDLGTDPELEKAIQGIAQTSNEAKEIATETMAEVFVKQGKIDKAVQLYIKLSFLDPEKSSYFAAKIQQLKGM